MSLTHQTPHSDERGPGAGLQGVKLSPPRALLAEKGLSSGLARFRDLVGKAWAYLLLALEQPIECARLPGVLLKGVHLGEHLKMNRPWIRQADIRSVIDIGAHAGEFSSAIRNLLPSVQIYAFEPLEDCFNRLRVRLEKYGAFQAFQVALGDQSGEIDFLKSSFSKASSVLPMARLHQDLFPWSAGASSVKIRLERLDSFAGKMNLQPKTLMKIDVQGYEDRVLRGSRELLKQVDYVLVEVSFRPLYEAQAQFHEVYEFLTELGFCYMGNMQQQLSPSDGSVLQADAFFVRNGSR